MKSHTFTRGVALAGALTLTHAASALAASAKTAATSSFGGENTPVNLSNRVATHTASSGGSSGIVRTIVGLFIVIAVIYGVAWILKQAKKGRSRATGNGLSQLASLPLGNGRSVALVRAGRDVVLVGIAENSITPLRTYTEAEIIASGIPLPIEEAPNLDPAEKTFRTPVDLLRRMTV